MHLSDAWDDVLTRRAEEAPGFVPPPLTSSLQPLAPSEAQPQVIVSALRLPKPVTPTVPMAPFTVARLGPITLPGMNAWDQITARRAAMPVRADWKSYVPYAIAALLAVALLSMKKQPERKTRHVTRVPRK